MGPPPLLARHGDDRVVLGVDFVFARDDFFAQELFGSDRHLALLAAVSVVLPAEGDLAVGHGQESVIGNGDAVCIACQVMEHVLRSAEGAFGVDRPLGPPH